jgi:gliding motility-associated-like protein
MTPLKTFWLILITVLQVSLLQAQGSNTCNGAAASPINLPFFANNQSTCGDLNDYTGSNGCAIPNSGNYYGGQDWLYSFTPSQNGYVSITLNDIQASGTAYPTISLFSACPGTAGACMGFTQCNMWQGGGSLLEYVEAGQTYFLLVDAYTWSNYFANCYQFDLSVQLNTITVQPACSNINFNNGTLNGWYGTRGMSLTGATNAITPTYSATSFGLLNGRQTIMTGGNDPCAGFPRVDPQGGPFSVRLGNNNVNSEAEQLMQTFMVSETNNSFTYRYAVVFEDPGHASFEQPFFRALLRDQNGNIIPCSDFVVSAAADLPGFFNSTTCSGVVYKPWSTVNVDLTNYIGQQVTVEFTTGDCSQGAHYGYAYIDANCAPSMLAALSDTLCIGQSTVLTAPSGYESYTWLPGNQTTTSITVTPAASTTYQLNLVAYNGCLSQFQIPVTVAPYPQASFTATTPTCDEPVQLQNTSTISTGSLSSVSWSIPGATPASSNLNSLSVSYPGVGPATFPVTLQVSSSVGCTSTVTQNVSLPACALSVQISGDTLCAGDCYTINPVISSGTPPYSYLWSDGSTGSSLMVCPNSSQIISLTVTDAAGNIDSDAVVVAVAAPPVFNGTVINPSCNGLNNGSIVSNPSGNAPLAFSWNTGSSSAFLTGLAAGTYNLSITDRFGCTYDSVYVLSSPAALTAGINAQQSTCGQSNGAVQILNVSGGTAPYVYSLNGGMPQALAFFINLAAGTYSITVTDAQSCSTSLSATVTNTSGPTQAIFTTVNSACGLANGSIRLNQILGGTAPFTLQLGGSTFSYSGGIIDFPQLNAGNYTLIVTDANGCTLNTPILLLNTSGPAGLTLNTNPATCLENNAQIQVMSVLGGAAPYAYSLNGGQASSQTIWSGLAAGNYTIEVTDANGCNADTSISLTALPMLEITAQTIQNVQCFGGQDGQVAVSATQGAAPFTVLWSNGSASWNVTGLSAGNYSVSVTDSNGCMANATLSVSQPDMLSLELSTLPTLCGDANGRVIVDATNGGSPSYTYSLNNGPFQSAGVFLDLAAGNYSVSVQDQNGCMAAASTVVQSTGYPQQIITTLNSASCGLSNGAITLQAIVGGIAPYQVSFDNAPSNSYSNGNFIFNDLVDGSYALSVTDANGCSIDTLLALDMIDGPSGISLSLTPATCNSDNAAIEVLSVNGGTPQYTFAINNSSYSNQQVWGNLSSGNYTISVSDASGCTIDTSVFVDFIPALAINAELIRNVSCFGGSNGQASVDVYEGTAPFTFTWSSGATGMFANNLSAGEYSIQVSDALGCMLTDSILISQPDVLQFSPVLQNPLCGASNGSISISNAMGGSMPYVFSLNAGAFSGNTVFQNLASGTYLVRMRDSASCELSQSVVLTMPSFPTLAVLGATNATCGLSNGSIEIESINGGVSPFTYSLNNAAFANVASLPLPLSGLNQGMHTIVLRDANGCEVEVSASVANQAGPTLMQTSTNNAVCNQNNGSVSVETVIGGTPPYVYSFNGAGYDTSQTWSMLAPGSYSITARDANGCEIDSVVALAADENVDANLFIIQPITCNNAQNGALQVNATAGQSPFTMQWNTGSNGNILDSLGSGIYSVTVTDANGCSTLETIVLSQPPAVSVDVTGPDALCEGDALVLQASYSGGSGHVDLLWPQHNHAGETLTVLPEANDVYIALAVDENGCRAIDSHFVALRALPNGFIVPDAAQGCAPVCINFGFNQTEGSPITNFNWSFNGQAGWNDDNQQFCFYYGGQPQIQLEVTDAFGCHRSLNATGSVTVYPQPNADFSRTPNEADLENPVFQFFNESTDASSFLWNFGDGSYAFSENPTHTYGDTGTYDVCLRVTSGFGCKDSVCKPLKVQPNPTLFAPNVFTPNQDGENERFKLVGLYVKDFRLEIFDRWGELIHVSTDIDEGWDGNYKGQRVQQDVYVWKAYVTNTMSKHQELIGRVTVLE